MRNITKEYILSDIKSLLYTKEHEWVSIDDNIATIGITDFAQGELGDIIFVEFPNKGDIFSKDESIGTLEAVKTVADIYSPLSGEIFDFNVNLEGEPELINTDPYQKGWIVKIKINNIKEVDSLLSREDYEKII